MYLTIRDPRSNTDVSIFTKKGKNILNNYIKQIGSGKSIDKDKKGKGSKTKKGILEYMIDTHFHPIDNLLEVHNMHTNSYAHTQGNLVKYIAIGHS
jgi:hypothetical protein